MPSGSPETSNRTTPQKHSPLCVAMALSSVPPSPTHYRSLALEKSLSAAWKFPMMAVELLIEQQEEISLG
jgi:hypothetical protein